MGLDEFGEVVQSYSLCYTSAEMQQITPKKERDVGKKKKHKPRNKTAQQLTPHNPPLPPPTKKTT